MESITKEIEFYSQKLKEAKAELYKKAVEKMPMPKVIDQEITDKYAIYHGDCIDISRGIPSDYIDYSIFSPPFSSLFTYSNSVRDMGNSTDKEFYNHFDFLVPELYRVTKPGRLLSFHCSDIPAMKERDGYMGMKDFPGILLRIFEEYGWIYHSKSTIRKDPLLEAVRTKALRLAHKQISKDSSKCGIGSADYIITVKKPGENKEPIAHGRGFEIYIGERAEPKEKKTNIAKTNKYSHNVWQRYADPIWLDINQTNTLNKQQARGKDDERHICPLQLDVISRCLELWSNPNDIVLSTFGGIGSEGWQAVKMNRRAIMIELKETYYKVMKKNMRKATKTTLNPIF